jgi:hypothetical protein
MIAIFCKMSLGETQTNRKLYFSILAQSVADFIGGIIYPLAHGKMFN